MTNSAFEGKLVRLRAPTEADSAVLNPLFIDPEVLSSLVSVPMGQSSRGFLDYIRSTRGDSSRAVFTIQDGSTGLPIGVCSLDGLALHTAPELGIWIGKEYWGRGYGADAVRTLCRFGFRHLGLSRITLHTLSANEAAVRAYEKAGFVREGLLRREVFTRGEWRDVIVMGLLAPESPEA